MDNMAFTWRLASEPFLLLYMFVLGANLSLVPQLTISKLCQHKFNSTVCNALGNKVNLEAENEVYAEATKWNTIIIAAVFIPAIVAILPIGAMADLVCRKKILLIPTVATFVQSLVYLICAKFGTSHVAFLAVGSSVTSIFGDVQGAIMLAYAYMASVTLADQSRTFRMALLEGSIFIGQGLGSFVSGLLVQYSGFVAAFALTMSTAFLNFVFVAFLLPAVKPSTANGSEAEVNGKDDKRSASFCEYLADETKAACLKLYQFLRKYVIRPNFMVLSLLAAAFFANSAVLGENVIMILFIKHSPLSLSAEQVGLYNLILHCTRGVGMSCLVFIISKCFDVSDYVLVILGLLSLISHHMSLCFASTVQMLYSFTVFSIAFPFAMSTIRAILTKEVSKEWQGIVLASVGILSLIGVTIMNFAANALFKATAYFFPGFTFLLLSGSSFLALIIVCFISFAVCKKKRLSVSEPEPEYVPLLIAGQE